MIDIRGLYAKYYNTDKIVLQNISFEVKKGEIAAILGPSGCGKTTLLNIISELIKNGQEAEIRGSVILKNQNGSAGINIVFQDPTLLPWRTVFANVSYGLEIKRLSKEDIERRTKEIMHIVSLENFGNYYPHQLSLGMQQRVNFARALVCNPEILLLDEPFSALDIKTKKKIQEEFLKIIKRNKITALFVTHNADEAFFMADKVIVLSKSPSQIKTIITNDDSKKVDAGASGYIELYEE